MYIKTITTTIITILFLSSSLFSQDITLKLHGTPEMKIDGDSNVRSWDADIKKMDAELVLQGTENISLETINTDSFKEFSISIPVESIDSGTRGLTRNIHNYLKADDFPNITFNLNRVTNVSMQNGSALITADGVINAAGKDHSVSMSVNARKNNDGSINFSGEQPLLMTDFGIDPPTAVMGTVRARDEIKIIYSVNFK